MTDAHRPEGSEPAKPVRTAGTTGIVATGSVLALLASPAMAIELGELQLQSALGQPLRASIAFALAPNEQIAQQCVYLRAASPGASLPTITRATTTLRGNRIHLRGDTPLREPMMNLQVAVDCAYTARLQRDYLIMLNPPGLLEQAETASPAATTVPESAVRPLAARSQRRALQTTRRTEPVRPVTVGANYRVRPGDTLSEIASRIDNRQVALWPAVAALHAANPHAFLNQDVDQLIAGSTLIIPASITGIAQPAAGQRVTDTEEPSRAAAETEQTVTARSYRGVAEGAQADSEPAVESRAAAVPSTATTSVPAVEQVATARASAPIAANNSPFVDESEVTTAPVAMAPKVTVSIPDTRIEHTAPPIAVGGSGNESPAQAWLVWLGGSGIAIVLGLFLFGRHLRERFSRSHGLRDLDDTQINPEIPQRRATDAGNADDTGGFNLRDTMAKADPFEVQVNLDDGSGFDSSEDVDVALDYSFASSGDYSDDVDQALARQETDEHTDIMSAPNRESSIEVHEESVDEENTGYDMSMIVDVTKQDFGSNSTTARDLQAIEVKPLTVDPGQSGTMDLTTEFDYEVLQQDYEDELTATQALNREIAEAAMELQDRLGEFDDDQSRISMAEDLEGTAEITAEMPASGSADNDTLSDHGLDDTDISEELTSQLPERDDTTVEMNTEVDDTVERRTKTG